VRTNLQREIHFFEMIILFKISVKEIHIFGLTSRD